MKNLIASVLICISYNTFSKDFKSHEIKRLNALGLELEFNSKMDKTQISDFKTILEKERKRRKKKTTGILLTSIGLLSTSSGILVLSGKSEKGQGTAIKGTAGGIILAAGILSAGLSIPFFKSAKKKEWNGTN